MDTRSARRIGRRQTVIAVIIALAVAYIIMVIITGDQLWLFSDKSVLPNILAGAFFVILSAIFIGGFTGLSILVRNKNCYWISIRNSFFILWLGTFLAALIGFFQEGIHDPFGLLSGVDNYIVKPLAMVTIFGAIPVIIIAIILGWSLKKANAGKESK